MNLNLSTLCRSLKMWKFKFFYSSPNDKKPETKILFDPFKFIHKTLIIKERLNNVNNKSDVLLEQSNNQLEISVQRVSELRSRRAQREHEESLVSKYVGDH